jgi:hypothetical protein
MMIHVHSETFAAGLKKTSKGVTVVQAAGIHQRDALLMM